MLLALAIFVATLVLVIWQPKGLGIGWSALAGAGVALATGVVHLSDVPIVWDLVWNATLTFVAVIIICSILDEAGFFEWAALHVARWGRGNGSKLFNLIVVLGAAIAAVFANDGAALTLTPIVFQMIVALKFSPKAAFALVMATGFIADTTSLPFIVSNLVNIVIADYFGIGFARYALVMAPVALVSLVASLVVLRLFFRRSIPGPYDVAALGAPADAVRDRLTFRAGVVVLAVLLVGYFVADPLGIPVAAVAAVCALAISLVAARQPRSVFRRIAPASDAVLVGQHATSSKRSGAGDAAGVRGGGSGGTGGSLIDVWSVVKSAPWQIVLFSLGMYLVVYGLRNQGLTDQLGQVLAGIAEHGNVATATGTGFLVAAMSSVMNNMPTALISALGIDAAGAGGLTEQMMAYASIIGADLGPKITPIGSLATLLWLSVLDRKGMHIGWGTYFRVGIVLTVPVLAITLLALAGWLTLLGA
ncbi:arsenical pump membrane protein [Cellulomonas hominis]|uniref:Arsenical pump membrane protein n=1 Tax=Cellulomonas hominis TaxID=156981 RepID=A0A511FFY3_9CELL|nr:arsenic transporter [Cellulomonas hominis]MBB5475123.1 arsenical pump membrane protein [Cellulomonas hominis]NKY05725.1 arsenic transporter [Cellulomonas hominis]GEL48155.1 arsenical pump membrane protein [Cellulomonas hominis]